MKIIRYSVDDLKRSISSFAEKPSMILVLLRHTPNPSSKFIDLDGEIPCARGTLVKFESTLYVPLREALTVLELEALGSGKMTKCIALVRFWLYLYRAR